MVTTEQILQTMNSWQLGELIAVCRKKCSGASSRPNGQWWRCVCSVTCFHISRPTLCSIIVSTVRTTHRGARPLETGSAEDKGGGWRWRWTVSLNIQSQLNSIIPRPTISVSLSPNERWSIFQLISTIRDSYLFREIWDIMGLSTSWESFLSIKSFTYLQS